jgi:BREX system ATP-binding protein BrxC/D
MTIRAPGITHAEAQQLWASLGEEGKAPTELTRASHLLPAYSVGVEQWIERLAVTYLQNLCREHAHFKVVLAPYGGGKTHFLMALGSKALTENFAAAYIPCGPGISLDKPLDIYREFVKRLQLPGQEYPGIQQLLEKIVENKRTQIEAAQAPDPDFAFEQWLKKTSRHQHPENAFGRVITEALRDIYNPEAATAGDAAYRWLQGDIDTLTKEELTSLRLAKVPAGARGELGRNLLMSLVKFTQEAGVHGVVLLFDEVETLFSARGKALLRILSAMRVLVDMPTGIPGGLPMLGVFSAVPDIMGQLSQYPALQQRLAVLGSLFRKVMIMPHNSRLIRSRRRPGCFQGLV